MVKGWKGVEKRDIYTKDQEKHPYLFRCPKPNCFYAVSAATEEEARKAEKTHECPYQGGITHIAGSITVTLVEDLWLKADKAYAEMIQDGLDQDEFSRRKGVVRGLCIALAVFMPPHFRTPDEVGHEIMKRATADPDYETPGLFGRRYEPIHIPTRRGVTEAQPLHNLSDEEIAGIKNAADSGIFTLEQIAKTYSVSVEVVRKLIS